MSTRHPHRRAGHRVRGSRRKRDRLEDALDLLLLRTARWYFRGLAGAVRPILVRRAAGAALAAGMTGAMIALGRVIVHYRDGRVPTG